MSLRQAIDLDQDVPEDCYREIAEKIARYCSDINSFLPWLVPLSQVNKAAHQAIKASRFNFFMTPYSALPKENMGLFILNKCSITATNVRLGTRMTLEGIELYLQGKFIEAEALFIKALCTHGSSNAMKILAGLSQLPGRTQLNLDRIITLYSTQEEIAIQREYKAVFPTDQHTNCACLLYEPRSTLQTKIQCFSNAVSQIYRAQKGISVAEAPLIKREYREYIISSTRDSEMSDYRIQSQLSYFDRIIDRIDSVFRKQFDACGFLGLAAPKEEPWYEKTETHKQIKQFSA